MAESFISSILPEEFIPKHKLLLFFNDIIADILIKADEYDLSSKKIDIENNKVLPDSMDSPLDWLIENGYKRIAYDSTKAHVFFSILTDFIYYMHESFSCSERGKITVAFSVSRKPLKDNLFYLCWLLVDSEELIKNILYKKPQAFDVSRIGIEMKEDIFRKAGQKIEFPIDTDLLVDVIYNKNSPKGLSRIWDQSLHIITANKRYPTSVGNLNFIFSDEKVWQEHWKTYYDKITFIMTFMIEVSIALFEEIYNADENTKTFNSLIRNIKYDLTFSNEFNSENYMELFKVLSFTCDECLGKYELKNGVLKEFIYDYLFTCPHCSHMERVGQYYIE
ncbi:hypothetical protein [Oceanobacillus sp. Castelsardo]|uniref:hypothetical protein n=1 Tax=Oceanobacillus sp. Castelsardo TaxID=1851204 RepID=UPI0008398BFD|nr:hypothetical protein [Oceanobacillus sp. Castelsardo]